MLFLDNNEKPAKCIKIPIIREKWSKEIFSDSRNCHVYSSSFTQQMGTENSNLPNIDEIMIFRFWLHSPEKIPSKCAEEQN